MIARDNLHQTPSGFQWTKRGQIFNPLNEQSGWIAEYAQSPSAVVFDTFVRVYFCSRGPADPDGLFISRLGYLDVDRDAPTRVLTVSSAPVLDLGGLGCFDEFGTNPASVIRVNDQMRVYYAGWTRCVSVPFNAAIGMAVSTDNGMTFQRLGPGPVLAFTPDEPFVIGSPKVRYFDGKWVLCYSAGRKWISNDGGPQPVYKIRMAWSDDGITWTRIGRDIVESVLEENECQASADISLIGSTYHMFFCYRYNIGFKSPGRGYRIGYASSTDLLHWDRNDSIAGLVKASEGWDAESISYPNVFEVGNRWFMLYQGNEIGRYGFGLAEMENQMEFRP